MLVSKGAVSDLVKPFSNSLYLAVSHEGYQFKNNLAIFSAHLSFKISVANSRTIFIKIITPQYVVEESMVEV